MKLILIFFISTLILSCRINDEFKESVEFDHHVVINGFEKEVNFSEIVNDIHCVALETNSESIIGNIDKSLLHNNLLYILSGQKVICFNKTGKYIYQINNIGKGPDEYIKILDISVSNNNLYLYDHSGKKILIYNSSTGAFKKHIKLKHYAKELIISNDTIFMNRSVIPNRFLPSGSISQLIVAALSNQKNVLAHDFPWQEKLSHINANHKQIISCLEKVYWVQPALNKIYKWNGKKFIAHAFFDFEEDNFNLIDYRESPTEMLKLGKAYDLHNVFENNKFISGTLNYKDIFPKTIIYDKRSQKYKMFLYTEKGTLQPSDFSGCNENYFYKFISPTTAKIIGESIKKNNESKVSNADLEILLNSRIDSNPIVVFFSLASLN